MAYSKPFFRWAASRSHREKSRIPHAFRPSCSSKWRLPVSTRRLAAARLLARPPTKASAPISGDWISASDNSAPAPETNVAGSPARRMNAGARVSAWNPPCEGALAITAFPANSATSSACTCTLIG